MPQPIIGIYNADSTATVNSWPIGEVNANSESPTLEVVIWNNKGGSTAVSDMKDCSVTCLDGDGGNTSEMTVGKWMNVLVNSTADTDSTSGKKIYSPIGGDDNRPLRAEGLTSSDGNVIKGTVNDGTMKNATTNHCKAKFMVKPPFNATEGEHDFRIRIEGFYT
jgi:hypothetical protein